MAVNCAAIPKDLMESELFGHEKGAFTGATSVTMAMRSGRAIGTLFLDEIGELDLKLQAKLLRLLDDRTFHRVGGEAAVPFAGRLICATNADLPARVRAGSFREDLLYRINVLAIPIPPLRERPDDIEWLAERFFEAFAAEAGVELTGISGHAMEELRGHEWPGNVRELRNRIERAVGLAPGPWILPGDLFPERCRKADDIKNSSLEAARDEAEKRRDPTSPAAQRRGNHRSRSSPRHLADHHVGEDAPARHRAGFCQLRIVRISEHWERRGRISERRPDLRAMFFNDLA